jgi:hypothetical protein
MRIITLPTEPNAGATPPFNYQRFIHAVLLESTVDQREIELLLDEALLESILWERRYTGRPLGN